MTDHLRKELKDFAAGIREWLPGLKWLARSAISIRTESDLIILHARAALLFNEPTGPITTFSLETKSLSVINDVVAVTSSTQDDMLCKLEQGQLEIAGRSLHLLRNYKGSTWQLSAHHSPFFHPSQPVGPRSPTVFLSAADRHNVYQIIGNVELLDWELKAADTPFASLEELSRFLGFDPTGAARIELTAQFPGLINNTSTLTKGTAQIHANVAMGMDKTQFKLGYVAYKAGATPVRAHLMGDRAQWIERTDYSEAVFRFDVADYPTLALYLSYKGSAIHQASISDPQNPANPRQTAYEVVDPQLTNLRKYLQGEGKSPEDDLEFAVACVFHLVGFSAIRFGEMDQFRNFSDIVGFAPSGKVVVAEVTTGPIDANGKLSKLTGRAFEIRDRLQQIGAVTTDVLPMVVTTLARGAIAGDMKKAGDGDISVVAKEDLLIVASQPSFDLDPEKAFATFKSQIPKVAGGSNSLGWF